MDFAQSGEPFTIVPSEEEVDGLVGVEPEELSYDLDGEDLGIGELGGWSAPSDAAFLESVVDEAEDADDEGAKIHRKRPPLASIGLGTTERREVSYVIQPFGKTCTRG